ncbi:replication-relaxation family protein [Myxococcota bacterium]
MIILSQREGEMLVGLWHLRYLATVQIQALWYPDRSGDACDRRLRVLQKEELIERVGIRAHGWPSAWRLRNGGLQKLREFKDGEFAGYERLTERYLPHLLETNDVFLKLEWVWERLGFEWLGSHRSLLAFRHGGGRSRSRNRVVRSDAVVTPKADGHRVFVELDRGTESIESRTGRTSIVGKLKAYESFLNGRRADGKTWYRSTFGDERGARLLFVVPQSRRESIRKASILKAAASFPRLDVRCHTADDEPGLVDAVGVVPTCGKANERQKPMTRVEKIEVGVEDVGKLLTFCSSTVTKLKELLGDDPDRARLRALAQEARVVLSRMSQSAGMGDGGNHAAR